MIFEQRVSTSCIFVLGGFGCNGKYILQSPLLQSSYENYKMNMSHSRSIFRILHSTLLKKSYSNYKVKLIIEGAFSYFKTEVKKE